MEDLTLEHQKLGITIEENRRRYLNIYIREQSNRRPRPTIKQLCKQFSGTDMLPEDPWLLKKYIKKNIGRR